MTPDTIAAIATPPGSGGIAIVRISGPEAFRIARAVFRERGAAPALTTRGLHVGWIVDPDTGAKVDQSVLLAFRAPHSYTTEDMAELQGHGGMAACARILRLVLARGARLAAPGEFTKRAFLGGRLDLTQAEAVEDLVSARTERALELAIAQLEGRLARAVRAARQRCVELLAGLEAAVDFPDDVAAPGAGRIGGDLALARAEIQALLATASAGALARAGATVAIVGRPNVGKSSLLNALAAAERAIVTPTPGTTRDVVEAGVQVRGIPLRLLDTAGIRDEAEDVEAIGVERSRLHLAHADLRILVVAADGGLCEQDRAIQAEAAGLPTLLVANKADLVGTDDAVAWARDGWLTVSALTGAGLAELEEALARELPAGSGDIEFAVNARHHAALEHAVAALDRAGGAAVADLPLDCVALDVREAVRHLGTVLGEDVSEEVLDVLFARFCIGK